MDNIRYKSIIIGTATKCKLDNNIMEEKIKMYRLKFSFQLKFLNFNDNSSKEEIISREKHIIKPAKMYELENKLFKKCSF